MLRLCIVLTLFVLPLVTVRAEAQSADDPEQYVIQVLTQDEKLIGTGTIVSFSGLALTAKHILRDTSESGASNFYASVLVRFKNYATFEQADVVALHPYLDIAVLQVRGRDAGRPAMKVRLKNDGLLKGQDITLIGHAEAGKLYETRSAKIDELSRHGHIIVSRGVRVGTSGGPAIVDGRLIGVIRNTGDDDRSTIVPIGLAVDYLRLMGIAFSDEGFARKTDDIAVLASRVSEYERILHDIQLDVSWKAAVARVPPPQGGGQPNLELAISYERKLEAQPTFDAKVTIGAVPIFGGEFASVDREKRLGFTYSDWLNTGVVRFAKFGQDVGGIVGQYKRTILPRLRIDDLGGFDVKALVSSILGDNYIRPPKPFYICFVIRIKPPVTPSQDQMTATGARCAEDLGYVDRHLPPAAY